MKKINKSLLDRLCMTSFESKTALEIEEYEKKNDITFPEDFVDYLKISDVAEINQTGQIKLSNEQIIISPSTIFAINWNGEYSWAKTIREQDQCEMEHMDSFFNFGSSFDYGEKYFIGVKKPYIGQIYVWHYLNGEAIESATFDEERQIYVYPKIKICDSFYDFLEFLTNNQENFKNDIIAEL